MLAYTGQAQVDLELPEEATAADLMQEIGRRFADNIPHHMWDREKETFAPMVRILANGTVVNNLAQPLTEGGQYFFILAVAGG